MVETYLNGSRLAKGICTEVPHQHLVAMEILSGQNLFPSIGTFWMSILVLKIHFLTTEDIEERKWLEKGKCLIWSSLVSLEKSYRNLSKMVSV